MQQILNRLKKRKRKTPLNGAFLVLAEWTGLEPATPGVTGRYSNQLNYHSAVVPSFENLLRDSPGLNNLTSQTGTP